jgi:hypothetical protein
MEGLEGANALAKQVLSQLSYTPTVGTCIDFKAFATVRKLRKRTFRPLGANPQSETLRCSTLLPVEIVSSSQAATKVSSFQPLPQWTASSRELADSAALESFGQRQLGR